MLMKNPKISVRAGREEAFVRGISADGQRGIKGSLNETGLLIWKCLDFTTDLKVIANTMVANYQIPFEVAFGDLEKIIASFITSGLLINIDDNTTVYPTDTPAFPTSLIHNLSAYNPSMHTSSVSNASANPSSTSTSPVITLSVPTTSQATPFSVTPPLTFASTAALPLDLKTADLFTTYPGPLINKAGLVVTSHCNFNCRHCYVDKNTPDLLTLANWKNTLIELKAMGCCELMIIGGEPFSQPWLCDLMEYADEEEFVFYVDTNGYFITDAIIERLKKLHHLMYIDISVYGLRPETVQQVTGCTFAPERIFTTIQKLTAAGITTLAKFVPMKSNFTDLAYLPSVNHQYGLKITNKYVPLHISQDKQRGLSEHISQENLRDLLEQNLITIPTVSEPRKHCGPSRCSINSNGDVSICENNILPYGNVLNEKLSDIWIRLGQTWQMPETSETCLNCAVRNYCARCDGISYLETGSLTAPVPYMCAHAQAVHTFFAKSGDTL